LECANQGTGTDPSLCIAKAAPKKDKRNPKDPSKAKQDKEQKWAWKKVLPKEGGPVTKVVNGKNYHLACEHHPNQWVCHTTAECSKNPTNNGIPKDAQAKQRLKIAPLNAAALLAEDDEEEEESDEDPDSYLNSSQRRLHTLFLHLLCWPPFPPFFLFITQLLSLWSWEFAAICIYAQALLWVLIAAISNPLSNPCVPKGKLSTCSIWLQSWLKLSNTAFDGLAIFMAPYIHAQSQGIGCRRSCAGSFNSTSTACPRRQRARPCNHAKDIVFSAVTMGVARTQAYCDNHGPAVT
jgi:hypothetical protein